MSNDQPAATDARDTVILALARQLGFATLETRLSDEADFREVAVWMLREALERAYDAGLHAAKPPR